jgi:FMN-dependent NADH-azoreductase
VLVITAPMWNFSVPAILKAWMDQVLSPGATFEISAQGVKGLHHIKKIILLTSSGGSYQKSDPKEHLLAEIKTAFGFVKIENVEAAWADGQNTFFFKDSKERKNRAIEEAKGLSDELYNT